MRFTNIRFSLAACAFAVLLSACGGGDATAPGGGKPGTSGFAVDGYLSGSTVTCDSNGNGIKDTGESSTTTDSSGFFSFTSPCTSALIATGGTSIDTNLPFTGVLKAPSGATVITPLTTLIASGMSETKLKEVLGITATGSLLTTDPARKETGSNTLVDADLMKKTLVIQQLVQKITEVVAGLATGTADNAAIYNEVMVGLAQALAANPALVSGSTISETSSRALIKAAILRIGTSSLPAGVKAGVAALNADSLAHVMAAALKAQGETILGASEDTLTAKTKVSQESTAITLFVQTNKANSALTGAPSAATDTLASTLKDTVSGVTPPTPTAGTVLLSFDESPALFSGMGAYGDAAPDVVAGPAGGSGSALKIVKPSGSQWWGGIYFNLPRIPFTAERKVITARVYSTRANATIALKVEVPNGANFEEVSAPIPANTWTNVTWTFSGVNPSDQYTVIAITPDKNESVTPSGTAYYIDNIALAPAASGGGGGSSASTLPITFDSAGVSYSFEPFEGASAVEVVIDPAGGTNKVGKVIRAAAGPWYGGVTVSTGANKSIATIPFTAGAKSMTMRVFSPGAGMRVRMKVENASNNNITSETDAVTVGTGWEVLTFNFNNPGLSPPVTGGPTASLNVAETYNKVTLFFNVAAANGAWGGAYYFDDIAFVAEAAGGGGGSASSTLVYASNYTESPPWKSTQGGDAGRYAADGAADWWSGLAAGDATPSYYFGYGLLPSDWGFGAFVKAPSNGTAQVSTYANVKISVWGNDQLVNKNPRPNFNLVMKAPAVAGGCVPEVQKEFQVTGAGVQTYTIALSGMTVRQDCGQPSLNTAAAILATGVTEVHVQVLGTNLNTTLSDDAGVPKRYPNGLNMGPISFTN